MAHPPYSTLPQWWRACCQERGGEVAARQKRRGIWESLSWADWYSQSRDLALALADLGLERGEVVTLLSENCSEWLLLDLAVQTMGGIVHGLYPTGSVGELAEGLQETGSRILIVEGAPQYGKWLEIRSDFPGMQRVIVINTRAVEIDGQQILSYAQLLAKGRELSSSSAKAFDRAIDSGSPAQGARLACTAGSTGPMQRMLIRQRSVMQQMRTSSRWLELDPGDRTLSVVSLANSGEYMLTVGSALASRSIPHFPESRATTFNDMREVAPQMVFASAWFWRQLNKRVELSMQDSIAFGRHVYQRAFAARSSRHSGWLLRSTLKNLRRQFGLQNARMAISGGTAIGEAQIEWYESLGVPLFEAYGLAQTSGFCSVVPTSAGRANRGHMAQLRIDDQGQVMVCAPGLMAEAWVQGEGQPEDPVNPEAWLATGDYGIVDAKGRIRVLGRLADHAPVEGQSGVPGFAERELRRSKFIADAQAFESTHPSLKALVFLDADTVAQHAHDRQMAFTDHASLARHPDIQKLIADEIALANRLLPESQQVATFRILEHSLSEEDEELTPMMQLRRDVVERLYAPVLASMDAT